MSIVCESLVRHVAHPYCIKWPALDTKMYAAVHLLCWCLQAAAPAGNGISGSPSNGEMAAGSSANGGSSSSGSGSSLVLSGEGVTEALLQRLLEQMHGPEVELKGVHPMPQLHSLQQTALSC